MGSSLETNGNGHEWAARLLDFETNKTAVVAAEWDAGFDLLHDAVVAEDLLGDARAAPACRSERVTPLTVWVSWLIALMLRV